MAETGQLINGRYLLQRLLQQGQTCVVYQGFDQVLQRAVAVKIAPAEYTTTYRAAMRATSQFSHPNIIGIYDLMVDSEHLYIVQEYVDGDNFAGLLQTQLTPYHIVDIGVQLCQALLYTGTSSRKVCHGDLTPAAIVRDRRGAVRINNFALPSDVHYFTDWSAVGGNGTVLSDHELPWGQLTEGRRSDDTRAIGILLYQLLAGRAPGATVVDPPPDGRLRFLRNIPPELCEVIARTIVRQHPQYISTPETLLAELKTLTEILDPPAVQSAASPYQTEVPLMQYAPALPVTGTGKMVVSTMPVREGAGFSAFQSGSNAQASMLEQMSPATPSSYADAMQPEMPLKMATGRQTAYSRSGGEYAPPRRLNVPLMLFLGLVLFALFFAAGFYLANTIFLPH